MRLRWAAGLALASALLVLWGCGSSNSAFNPTPQISGLSPSEITAGSQSFTLFVSGTQFISTSVVQWNGSDRPTTYNSASTQLAATISAADVQNAGIAQVTVTSPAPGGGRSLATSFTINPAQSGGPTITSLSPSSAALNAAAFTLTVNGTNFVPGDYVTWNGGLRVTCPMGSTCSSTQLAAQILASDLTQQIVASVAVHTSQLGVASPSVSFAVGNAPTGSVRFPQLISVSRRGGAADGQSSSPAISADGRYVAFYSQAKDLVSGSPAGNIFLRDTCVGLANCQPQTTAVDVGLQGGAPNGSTADQVAISADGRYVAFVSQATNLSAGAHRGSSSPQASVFLRDVCAGRSAPANCSPGTEVVSVDATGNAIEGGDPSVSADGRFVSFTTPGPTSGNSDKDAGTVMVRDTCHGSTAGARCIARTVVASVNGAMAIDVDASAEPAISASGRYVVFASRENGTNPPELFLRDTCLGVSANETCVPSTARVSVGPDGQLGNARSSAPAISGDGRFVVFQSAASNLADRSGAGQQIYLRDTCAGSTAPFGCAPSTTRISAGSIVPDAAGGYSPAISASGRYISFIAQTRNEDAPAGSGNAGYIVVYDSCFGATGACSPHVMELAAADSSGSEVPLTGDIRVHVPVTNDGGLAAFFTFQPVPKLRASGFGDVFLTTTPFWEQQY
jgi:Tol biopolymer transport system component